MTDTELYEIVKDVPRELWPEGLKYGSFQLAMPTALALLIWEGKLSRVVNERGLSESCICGSWVVPGSNGVGLPTRIEALVAAVKESQ